MDILIDILLLILARLQLMCNIQNILKRLAIMAPKVDALPTSPYLPLPRLESSSSITTEKRGRCAATKLQPSMVVVRSSDQMFQLIEKANLTWTRI